MSSPRGFCNALEIIVYININMQSFDIHNIQSNIFLQSSFGRLYQTVLVYRRKLPALHSLTFHVNP